MRFLSTFLATADVPEEFALPCRSHPRPPAHGFRKKSRDAIAGQNQKSPGDGVGSREGSSGTERKAGPRDGAGSGEDKDSVRVTAISASEQKNLKGRRAFLRPAPQHGADSGVIEELRHEDGGSLKIIMRMADDDGAMREDAEKKGFFAKDVFVAAGAAAADEEPQHM